MKKIIFTICGLSLFFALTAPVFAQVGIPDYLKPENLPDASRGGTGAGAAAEYSVSGIQFIIGDIISIILLIAGLIAVFSIVNNAWYMVIAMGKGENFDQRKKALFWAIGGLVLILTSYIIIRFLVEFATTAFQEVPAPPAPAAQEQPAAQAPLPESERPALGIGTFPESGPRDD